MRFYPGISYPLDCADGHPWHWQPRSESGKSPQRCPEHRSAAWPRGIAVVPGKLRRLQAEVEKLRGIIDAAPHWRWCALTTGNSCDCWKADPAK